MRQCDLAHDRQTEPRPVGTAGDEGLEQAGTDRGIDPGTRVGDAKVQPHRAVDRDPRGIEANLAAGRRVLQGVQQEVVEGAGDLRAVEMRMVRRRQILRQDGDPDARTAARSS